MTEDRTSDQSREATDSRQTQPPFDWLAWWLQLLFGFLVGAGVGFVVARYLLGAGLTDLDEMLLVAIGVGLGCGAFTSFYGDRAWMPRPIFAGPEPTRPPKARACSVPIGGIGTALVVVVLARHLIDAARRGPESSARGFDPVLLLIGVVPGFLLVHALRTGTGFWGFGIVDQEETPLIFWIYVLLNGVLLLCILSAMLR